jgi:hypothetical protein
VSGALMLILKDELQQKVNPLLKGVMLQLCQVIAIRGREEGGFEQSKAKLKVSRRLLYAQYVLYVLYVVALANIIKLIY